MITAPRPAAATGAHVTLIAGLIVAVLALGALTGWLGFRAGHKARGEEVSTLADIAKAAKVDRSKAEKQKSSAIADANREKSQAIADANREKSKAIAEVEARANQLLATSEKNQDKLGVENRVLRERLVLIETELSTEREATGRLKQSLDGLQRQLQIDKVAYDELRKTLESSSGDLAKLRDELNFYRSILSPEGQKAGVQIQNFTLKETTQLNQYQYRITLIQARQHDTNVKGVVNLEIEGSQNGIGKIVDVALFGTPPGRADFKYYQNLQGIFDLPEDFAATGVRVVVKSDLAGNPVEQWYPWPQ